MIKQLTKLANHLDSKGLLKEADFLDSIIISANESAEQSAESAIPNTPSDDGKRKSLNAVKEMVDEFISQIDNKKRSEKSGCEQGMIMMLNLINGEINRQKVND